MNITLSIEENTVKKARKTANSMGKSLNQLIRDYLEQLVSTDDIESELMELDKLTKEAKGHSAGWKFDRDTIHERT